MLALAINSLAFAPVSVLPSARRGGGVRVGWGAPRECARKEGRGREAADGHANGHASPGSGFRFCRCGFLAKAREFLETARGDIKLKL